MGTADLVNPITLFEVEGTSSTRSTSSPTYSVFSENGEHVDIIETEPCIHSTPVEKLKSYKSKTIKREFEHSKRTTVKPVKEPKERHKQVEKLRVMKVNQVVSELKLLCESEGLNPPKDKAGILETSLECIRSLNTNISTITNGLGNIRNKLHEKTIARRRWQKALNSINGEVEPLSSDEDEYNSLLKITGVQEYTLDDEKQARNNLVEKKMELSMALSEPFPSLNYLIGDTNNEYF